MKGQGGSWHYLCQLSLGLNLGVEKEEAAKIRGIDFEIGG